MGTALIGSKIGVASVPNDPTPNRSYFFRVNVGGKGYVLGAVLEDPGSTYLVQGAHGVVNGMDCSGSTYCIRHQNDDETENSLD